MRPSRRCRRWRDLLPQKFYGGLDERRRLGLERHLGECAACAGEWEVTERALGAVDSRTAFPLESRVDWDRLARDTVVRAREAERRGEVPNLGFGWRWRPLRPAFAWGGSLLAVALTTMIMVLFNQVESPGTRVHTGSTLDSAIPGSPQRSARALQETLARQGAARYLRDSRALLVSLIEAPVRCRKSDAEYDLSLERQRSRELLRKKNLYIGSLGGARDQRLADLVEQLETLLLRVSSFEDCTAARQIHELRQAIDRRQILMRIDLMTRSMDQGAPRV